MNRVDFVTLKLAIVEGAVNDFAVYVGPEDWSFVQIKTEGMKLSHQMVFQLLDMGLIDKSWRAYVYRD